METITFSNEEEAKYLLDRYDEIINITIVNLYSLSKTKGIIVLSNIDRKSKDHLYILRIAMMAKDTFNFPLKLHTSFWNWLCLNWRMRKLSRRVPREKNEENAIYAIDVKELIEFMYPPIREYIGENFKFEDIYEAFYRKELD